MSFWPNMQASLSELLSSGIMGWFVSAAMVAFGAIAVARLSVFGLRATNGAYGDQWVDQFERLLFPIVIGYMLLSYWAVPIPGIGYSFPRLLTASVHGITQKITVLSMSDVITSLSKWQSEMESPTIASFVAMFDYAVVCVLIWVMQGVGFVVTAVAMIAAAVCMVVGPLFISTMLWPNMDWVYRGWLRSFIQYATMPVTVAMVAAVVGNFVVKCMTALPHKTVGDLAAYMGPIVIVLASGIAAVAFAPVIHNHMFSGSSGSGSGFIGYMAGRLFR